MNGAAFSFFSNNNGSISDVTKAPEYRSFAYQTCGAVGYISNRIWDPRKSDTGLQNTNKLFYNKPSTDLPLSAPWTNGPVSSMNPTTSTWLKAEDYTSSVYDLEMTCDGVVSFKINKNVNYTIAIYDGEDNVIKTFRGSATAGAHNMIVWDKMTQDGIAVSAGTELRTSVVLQGGEVHFPLIDAEANLDGIIIQ